MNPPLAVQTNSDHRAQRAPDLKRLAFALAVGLGLGAGGVQAQTTVEVGGAGTIGTDILSDNKVPAAGVNWKAVGGTGAGVYSGLVSPAATVQNTGPVTLTFTHRYDFESGWDGGAIFVRVNGGAATYLAGTAFSANGYTGTTTANTSTAWPGGEQVFTGQSAGYGTPVLITSVADLGTLNANDTVTVEFRGGWDDGTVNGPPGWEVGTVVIADSGVTLLDADFTADGPSGFTVANIGTVSGPWSYLKPVNRFEINGTTLAVDQYAPSAAGSVIDLNGANIQIALLPGTLSGIEANDAFVLFDLSGGTTLTGAVGTVSLPAGTWDTSNLATTGTIVCTAPPVFEMYEPFADTNSPLEGNTPGAGLSGTWASSGVPVLQGGLFWGSMPFTGDRHIDIDGRYAYVSTGSNLSDFGMLDDGKELWFSTIIKTGTDINTNPDIGMALGSHYISVGNNLPMANTNGGLGLGFTIKNNQIRASYWNPTDPDTTVLRATTNTSNGLTAQTHYLVVGKFQWGATEDILSIYLPDTALNLGAVRSTMTVNVNQSLFNILTLAAKGDGDRHYFDEIRFGATAAAVMPVDTAPLTLAPSAIVDNKAGGPILESQTVIYTLTFNKNLGASTIDASDFENGGTAPININSLVVAGNQVTVTVTPAFPGATGTLQLQVKAGAVISDFAGTLSLDTTSAVADDTVITVNADTVLPTVVSITSPAAATPIYGLPAIPYVVTFDKYFMDDATVTTADFSNLGSASISVDSVTRTSTGTAPATYAVQVTPTSTGTLQLRLSGTVQDAMGNAVAVPVDDDAVYTFASPEPAKQTITLDSVLDISLRYVAGSTKTFAFDASASDKVVVIGTGEHNFGGNLSGKIKTVTYDGVSLIKAVEQLPPLTTLQTTSSLWYLDDPAAATASANAADPDPANPGTIRMTVEGNGTNYVQTAFGLSGTAPGFAGAASIVIGAPSTNLLVSSPKSMVISWLTLGGGGNTAGTAETVLANSPPEAVTFGSKRQPNSYAGHALAHSIGLTPGVTTFSFNTSLTDVLCLAAEFLAADEPVSSNPYATWATTNAPTTGSDPSADEDGDGVSNGVEFVLGGTSGANDLGKLPAVATTPGGDMTVTFVRDQASIHASTALSIEVSTDLATWDTAPSPYAVPDTATAGPPVAVVDNLDGTDTVTLTVAKGSDTKKFARLKVVVTP